MNNSRAARRRTYLLFRRFYSNYTSEDDVFAQVVQPHLRATTRILDAGCGDGTLSPHDYRAPTRRVTGADVEASIQVHPRLDQAAQADLAQLPFARESFDLVLCKFVVEHLENPRAVFAEFHRVLAPRGIVVLHAPNGWHYIQIIARLTPHAFHDYATRRVLGRRSFEKFHRANSPRGLIRQMRSVGFRLCELRLFESAPDYLTFFAPFYLVGVLYERLVNRWEQLAFLRQAIIASFRMGDGE